MVKQAPLGKMINIRKSVRYSEKVVIRIFLLYVVLFLIGLFELCPYLLISIFDPYASFVVGQKLPVYCPFFKS